MKNIIFILKISCFFVFYISFAQQNDSINKYTLGFQMTSVYQYHPEFKAKYSGENSLNKNEESALSLTSTLFLDVPLWKGSKFTFNPEMSGGSGISEAKGLGGFPNGETFRVGETKPVVYLARLLLEQNFDLKNDNSLKIIVGKFGLADYFDANNYSHDPRKQFLNWSLMNHGAWDYAANTRGYTIGFYTNYKMRNWQFRFAITAVPTEANGPNVEFNFTKKNSLNIEIERKITFSNNDILNIRALGFSNLANMGNYNLANQNFIENPDVSTTRKEGRNKYGFGINADFTHKENWGFFTRMSYNDGKNETWAFTEIDKSFVLGMNLKGKLWNRPEDFAGFATVFNGLSNPHKEYQKLGGNGFMIGDGNINYGLENIYEAFYSFSIPKTAFIISPNYQFAINPGYNKDRGPVHFFGLRFHTEF